MALFNRWVGRSITLLACAAMHTPRGASATPSPQDSALAGATTAAPASVDAVAPTAEPSPSSPPGACVERIPEGKTRPEMEEAFPSRGRSGHALWLDLTITHGQGETVLPGGFNLQQESPEYRSLTHAGFTLPLAQGPFAPKLEPGQGAESATTHVRLPFLALPGEPGSSALILPALPIAIARASGEIMSVCTLPHPISIDDPTTNSANPEPHGNTAARRQREPWTAAKNATYGALAALLVGSLLAWAIRAWMKRDRPRPVAPPPRPAWEVALEQLAVIKNSQLVAQGHHAEHYARVAHVVRGYLGARYSFDGLECTTRELTRALDRITPAVPVRGIIDSFLWRADLVKFARLTPAEEECTLALGSAEQIVHATRAPMAPAGSADPSPPDALLPDASPPDASPGASSPDTAASAGQPVRPT